MSLSAALAAAGNSLELFSTGLQVAGQNIANSNTPGYIREALVLETGIPYRRGALIVGSGAQAVGVQQQIDQHLEVRILDANGLLGSANALLDVRRQLEAELGELGTGDLSSGLSGFVAALQDLAAQPESLPLRQIVVDQGQSFADSIVALRGRVDDLWTSQETAVDGYVDEANRLIDRVRDLNSQIVQLEAGGLLGSDAGGLRTERYTALNRLSEILPVTYREQPTGAVDVFTGSDYLVLGSVTQHLETYADASTGSAGTFVRLSVTGAEVSRRGGELGGTIEARDDVLGGFVADLDRYTASAISGFNRLHASGQGTRGFASLEGTNEVLDAGVALNDPAAGLDFPPTHGSFVVRVKNVATGIVSSTTVNVDLDGIGADTTLSDLQAFLDGSVPNLSASLTTDDRLRLAADAGYEFSFADDTSGVLTALGLNTFFTGSGSADIAVNDVLRGDAAYLAAAQGGGPSDGSNAVRLAAFDDDTVSALGGRSLVGFYEDVVGRTAQATATQQTLQESRQGYRDSLQNQREQFSGVSLDEEAIRILDFQRAYQAAARIVSAVDELMEVLVNL